jgi:hypothetical protein
MKVSIQFDEAAELSPREVRLMHELAERRRQLNRQLAQCAPGQVVVVRASGFCPTLGELFERKTTVR